MGRSIPKWVKSAVRVRDEGRCVFPIGDRRVCGRTADLWVEQKDWVPDGIWDPSDFRMICVYHLRGGHGLKVVDWRHAATA